MNPNGRDPGNTQSSSFWGDINNGPSRISPPNNVLNTSPPIPLSISPINNLIQQQQQQQQQQQSIKQNMSSFAQVAASLDTSMLNPNAASLVQQIQALNSNGQNNLINLNTLQMLSDNNIKDKIQMLFEQTKKEEERRRKQEEYQIKVSSAKLSSFISISC